MANEQKKSAAAPRARKKAASARASPAPISPEAASLEALPGLSSTVASYLWPRAASGGMASTAVTAPWRAAAAAVAPSRRLTLPLQSATVDRSVPTATFSLDVPVRNKAGKVIEILRRPLGYPSGPLPADPGYLPGGVDPRTAICHILSRGAAARCSQGRGYF